MPSSAAAADIIPHSDRHQAAQLGDEIIELCGYLYAAESKLLELIRQFDEQKCWRDLGLCSCAHWLNFKCGIGMNAAREKIRVAHALTKLAGISEAFSRGARSYSKVRALTRIADASNESYLLMIAKHGTAHHVEKLVAKFRVTERLQDVETAADQFRQRELNHYYDHDGCLVIKARLPAEQGALIVKALQMALEAQEDKSKEESLLDDVTAGGFESEDPTDTSEPIAARRADALAELAEIYMTSEKSSGSRPDRYQVVVHVTAGGSHIEDGPHVIAETSRRIGCDSLLVKLFKDQHGEPLSIGRKSRTIPPPMRRALQARDGGCRFPGCTHTRFVDGHHLQHWAEGGETSLDNLVLLCRHHHHLVHDGGFACEKDDKGKVRFRDTNNRALEHDCLLPSVTSREKIQQWLDNRFFEMKIDIQTCTAKWYAGEQLDWQMAVSELWQLKRQALRNGQARIGSDSRVATDASNIATLNI